MKEETIVILGGGPSGLMCAYQLSKNFPDKNIILIDRKKVGSRIRVSGNGRCNFGNDFNAPSFYNHPEFVDDILNDFLLNRENIYKELGLYYRSDSEGRRYPLTNSAVTVLNLFKNKLQNKVLIINDEIMSIKEQNGYHLYGKEKKYFADKLILAYGNIAYGNDINSFNALSKNLSLPLTELYPSLCPLVCKTNFKKLNGKRVKANVTLYRNNEKIVVEKGEILFKKDGISGICVFNLSSYISRNPKASYRVAIDLVPELSEKEIQNILNSDKNPLNALKKILIDEVAEEVFSRNKNNLATAVKNFYVDIEGLYPYEDAQVICGGIDLKKVDSKTLRVQNHQYLYVIGELLDIDGISGGFNIEWAFASGYRAAKLL